MTVRLSRGTINRKTWRYCDQHQQMILKTGRCADAKCKGKLRERFEYCFTYLVDGVKRRARGQAPSRSEAETAMEARKSEMTKAAEPVVAPPITLNEYADKWLVNIASSVEPRTLQSYTDLLKSHVRPALGDLPLTAVTRGRVRQLLAEKRASGLRKNTIRLIRATISGLFVSAVDDEIVTANPAAKLGRSRTPDTVTADERRQDIKAMTVDQLDTFLKAAATSRHFLLFLTMADTGMRPGEALALRWSDLDLARRQVTISRAAERGGRVKATKTRRARVIDLTSRLVAALDRRQVEVEAEALVSGRTPSGLVFPGASGRALDDKNISRVFGQTCIRAGLPRFPGQYTLRHSYASHLLGDHVPLTYVSNQLGHAKPVMTLLYYAHFLPTPDRRYADQLEAIRSGRRTAGPQGDPQETGAETATEINSLI